jgi:hypothetical protein
LIFNFNKIHYEIVNGAEEKIGEAAIVNIQGLNCAA